MSSDDTTERLAYETRRLRDLTEEKGELWADQGGRTTLHEYLHPHDEAAEDLVRALRDHNELLAAFETEMAVVERELEVAAAAHGRTEEALAQAMEDVRAADETLPEVLQGVAAAAKLEARAVRLADLANEYPGAQEPSPVLMRLERREWDSLRRAIEEERHAQRLARLADLQQLFPSVGVRHLLEGEFNKNERFIGFHSRLSRVGKVFAEGQPDTDGVYRAVVAGRHPQGALVLKKVLKHTMFPDNWSEDRICRELLKAYESVPEAKRGQNTWKGLSPSGVLILGHIRPNGSIIGYPLMKGDPRC